MFAHVLECFIELQVDAINKILCVLNFLIFNGRLKQLHFEKLLLLAEVLCSYAFEVGQAEPRQHRVACDASRIEKSSRRAVSRFSDGLRLADI